MYMYIAVYIPGSLYNVHDRDAEGFCTLVPSLYKCSILVLIKLWLVDSDAFQQCSGVTIATGAKLWCGGMHNYVFVMIV